MSLLLDTHALLWFVLDEPRLSATARNVILEAEGEVFVSPASLWEIAIKIGLGKYAIPAPFEEFWSDQLDRNSLSRLPIRVSHLARVVELPKIHRDPFDRLLIAQSLAENIDLISGDTLFDGYGVKRIW